MLAIPVGYLTGQLSVAILAVAAALLSGLEAFFLPAVQSTLPRLVEPSGLTSMVSLLDSTDRLGRILGPGLVGLLALVVPEIHLFTIDAASFVLSAWFLTLLIRRTPARQPVTTAPDSTRRAAFTAGWRTIFETPVIRDCVALRAACNLAGRPSRSACRSRLPTAFTPASAATD